MLSQHQIAFLKEILNTCSPSGYEHELVWFLRNYMKTYCSIETDSIGNLYMWSNKSDGNLSIMITAHSDEVGFQVTHIDKDGYIYFRGISGIDQHTVPGSKVVALTKNGRIAGVVGKKSPHVMDGAEKDKVLPYSNMWIDFGFESKDEADRLIEVGDYITLCSEPQVSPNGKRIVSKALDNKICVFILSEVLKELSKCTIPISVVGVATAQEELSYRGAMVAANRIRPDIAICLDVGIATDIPMMSVQKYGNFTLGNGVGIVRNADSNDVLVDSLIDTAEKYNINHQLTVGYRPTGGTETAVLRTAYDGVVTANLSIPSRYLHSLVEMCDLRDVESAINLLIAEIKSLKDKDKRYFNLYQRKPHEAIRVGF